jgi:hypothetical protein
MRDRDRDAARGRCARALDGFSSPTCRRATAGCGVRRRDPLRSPAGLQYFMMLREKLRWSETPDTRPEK